MTILQVDCSLIAIIYCMPNQNLSKKGVSKIFIIILIFVSLISLGFLFINLYRKNSNTASTHQTSSKSQTMYSNSASADSNESTGKSDSETKANLIIGTVDKGSNYEISVCLQSTSETMHLTDSSTWFNFEPKDLTPNPEAISLGKFNNNESFGQMAWNKISGNIWGLDTIYNGSDSKPSNDSLVPTTKPELISRVSFTKNTSNASADSITLKENKYFTTELRTKELATKIIKTDKDCTTKI